MQPFTPPQFELKAFNCPHCNAYAQHEWQVLSFFRYGVRKNFPEFVRVECAHCGNYSLWLEERMLYPEASGIPMPNSDLDEDIKTDYLEARSIVEKSPRGAAALLRLCVQKLCRQLGEKGKDINDDIRSLVKKELPYRIQQALDIVRVIGNNAVHPGQIDFKDNKETAYALFGLINAIADRMITQPKEVERIYNALPSSALDAIEKRDK